MAAGLLCTVIAAALILRYDVAVGSAAEMDGSIETLLVESNVLSSISTIDQARAGNIRKALSVIDRFNPAMPEHTKQAIAAGISEACMKYDNLNIDLLCATITHESAFSWNPEVISPAGAMGLMQIMPATGRFLAEIEGITWTSAREILFDPVTNIRLGSRYLSNLIGLYDVDGGLAAYNGGGMRAAKWLALNRPKGVLLKETQHYVPAVLALYDQFRN